MKMPPKEGDAVFGPDPAPPGPTSRPSTRPSLLLQLDDKDLQALKSSALARYKAQEEGINVARKKIESEKSQITSSEAMLADANRDLGRQKKLVETHDVSQSVVDTAQAKCDEQFHQLEAARRSLEADQINLIVMQHQLDAAKADVDKADEDISYTVITSPIDGIVTSVKAEVGEMVVTGTMNNAGTVIMEVADLNKMLMVAHMDESNIDAVKEGQKATVHIPAYRDQVFRGTLQTVGQSRTEDKIDGTKYFEVKILLDLNGRRIRSGLSADADIETKRHDKVLTVPSQAVVGRPVDQLPDQLRHLPEIEKGKQFATVVYRLINGKAVVTPVKVGPSDDTRTIIESGLKEGESIIVGPYKALESIQNDQAVQKEGDPTTRPAAAAVAART